MCFSFLFSACAHQRVQEKLLSPEQKKVVFEDSLKKLCLNSEGKGRLVFLSERYSFNYESLLEEKLYSWTLAIEVPMLGQELFKLNYKNSFEGKVFAQGNFYDRLILSAKNEKQSRYHLEVLNSYLLGMGKFLIFKNKMINPEEMSKSCQFSSEGDWQGSCLLDGKQERLTWKYEDEAFYLRFPLDAQADFILEAQGNDKDYFKRFKMKLKDKTDLANQRPLEIDLSLSGCN